MKWKSHSKAIRHERCPECAKKGKDRKGDNLAVYSDGHTYCFSCGHGSSGSIINRIKSQGEYVEEYQGLVLPFDSSYEYPQKALDWVAQYDLDRNTLIRNRVVWSEWFARLYFPVWSGDVLVAFQGRYLGTEVGQKKWTGLGKLEDVFHILKGTNDTEIILVEDIISALKLQMVGHSAMPLFGSHISVKRLQRIKNFYENVAIWLDPDKRQESIKFTRLASTLGLKVRMIYSDRDPKELTAEEIKDILKC